MNIGTTKKSNPLSYFDVLGLVKIKSPMASDEWQDEATVKIIEYIVENNESPMQAWIDLYS